MYFWIDFALGGSGCLEANDRDAAIEAGRAIREVRDVNVIPYPSQPYLSDIECPDFCYQPSRCKGRTACPQNPSCTS